MLLLKISFKNKLHVDIISVESNKLGTAEFLPLNGVAFSLTVLRQGAGFGVAKKW